MRRNSRALRIVCRCSREQSCRQRGWNADTLGISCWRGLNHVANESVFSLCAVTVVTSRYIQNRQLVVRVWCLERLDQSHLRLRAWRNHATQRNVSVLILRWCRSRGIVHSCQAAHHLYRSDDGCMRIFNVHFVSVVAREVIHSAASQSVCCMCSVVQDDMDSFFHLTWLMPMLSTRVMLVSFPVWPRCTTSVSWFAVDGCGIQVVALVSLAVRTNGGSNVFFSG